MNKLESNIALLSVTMVWGCQYIFYKSIPEDLSVFAFQTLVGLIASVLLAAVFRRELRNTGKGVVRAGFLSALPMLASSVLIVEGSRLLPASVSAFAATLFIVFVPAALLILRKPIPKGTALSVILLVSGLALVTGVGFQSGWGAGIVYILISDVIFVVYLMQVDKYTRLYNPVLLAIYQVLFVTVISFAAWSFVQPKSFFAISYSREMMSSIIIVAVFYKGYSTIMQLYAQRYANVMHATAIFSLEPVFTLLLAMLVPMAVGSAPEYPTAAGAAGCLLIVAGTVVSNMGLSLPKLDLPQKAKEIFLGKNFAVCLAAYTIVNLIFRALEAQPLFYGLGPVNMFIVIFGLLFGAAGAFACAFGHILSDLLADTFGLASLYGGAAMFICSMLASVLWYAPRKTPVPDMKRAGNIARYMLISAAVSVAAAAILSALAGFAAFAGIFIRFFAWQWPAGIPIFIVMTSIWRIQPEIPWYAANRIVARAASQRFEKSIERDQDAIGAFNDEIMDFCMECSVEIKKTYGIMLAIEEMLLRIIGNPSNGKNEISVSLTIDDMICITIEFDGAAFNPLVRKKLKHEDETDYKVETSGIVMVVAMSLKAQHTYRHGRNVLEIII